jgi:hypothetical protein
MYTSSIRDALRSTYAAMPEGRMGKGRFDNLQAKLAKSMRKLQLGGLSQGGKGIILYYSSLCAHVACQDVHVNFFVGFL